MEGGDVFSRSGILSSSVVTVAPGKQQVVALKKRTCLRMESPTIRVECGNSGRGERCGGAAGTAVPAPEAGAADSAPDGGGLQAWSSCLGVGVSADRFPHYSPA